MKEWIVYRHTSPSGKVYIGITSNVKDRWANNGYNYCRYNSIFKHAIERYGWDNIQHEILLEGCSKSEANYAERYLIKWYKTHGLSYNITDGGEGSLGRFVSDATREKSRISNLGQKRTKEQCMNISKGHYTDVALTTSRENIKKAHNSWKGSHHTDVTRRRMSERAKGRDMSKAIEASRKVKHIGPIKPIIQLDLNNFIINYFSSISEAKKYLGKTSNSIENCLQGRAKTAFGYRWEYKN